MMTATCFYFITESTKQAVYAPVVLIGCCSSSLIVMGLSYLGDLVGKHKVVHLKLSYDSLSNYCRFIVCRVLC